jgi:AcrR family transcriptional regulator
MSAAATPDGRTARRISTRQKIVGALVALVQEGRVSPTAQQVAERAQVGLRTVFRHFDDMDSLYREIHTDIDAALVQPLLRTPLQGIGWQARLLQSVERRGVIFERLAAMHLAAQVHRYESSFLAGSLMDAARLQRQLLERLLPAAAKRQPPLLEALDLLLSFEAWIRLRREQGLSADQARETMRLGVTALLSQAGLGPGAASGPRPDAAGGARPATRPPTAPPPPPPPPPHAANTAESSN